VGTCLTEGKDLKALLRRCAAAVLVNLGAVLVRIWTIEEEGHTLHLRASAGDPAPGQSRSGRFH
jgi:hypothetical protein